MFAQVGDILRIRPTWVMNNVTSQNVFFVKVVTIYQELYNTPVGFARSFADVTLKNVAKCLSLSCKLQSVYIENYTAVDRPFFNFAYEIVGSQTAEALPPQSAWSFRQNVSTRTTRSGQKRFMGVPEIWQSQGKYVPVTGSDLLIEGAEQSLGNGSFGDGTQFIINPTESPEEVWQGKFLVVRLAPTAPYSIIAQQEVTQASFNENVSHQVTRKY